MIKLFTSIRSHWLTIADLLLVLRQMKTINYQLSSMKCFEEGWTLRPPSSFFDDSGATDYSDLFELNITSGPWAKHSEMVSEGSSNGLAASVIARKLIIKPLCSVLYFSLFVSQLFCCTFKVMAYRESVLSNY